MLLTLHIDYCTAQSQVSCLSKVLCVNERTIISVISIDETVGATSDVRLRNAVSVSVSLQYQQL